MQERTIELDAHLTVSGSHVVERMSIESPQDPRCEVREVLDRVADKWTALAITLLGDGPLGYAEMRRATAGISDKMLAQTLRKLGRDGLVSRTVHAIKPVRVTYALTPLGETILPPLAALRQWAVEHGPELVDHQAAFDHGSAVG